MKAKQLFLNFFVGLSLASFVFAVIPAGVFGGELGSVYVGKTEVELSLKRISQNNPETTFYRAYRGSQQIYQTGAKPLSDVSTIYFWDSGLTEGSTYSYRLERCDLVWDKWECRDESTSTFTITAGDISGTIRNNMAWNGGTWNMVFAVTIDKGATLSISPSTVVANKEGTPLFEIYGQLKADNVIFTGAGFNFNNYGIFDAKNVTFAKNSTINFRGRTDYESNPNTILKNCIFNGYMDFRTMNNFTFQGNTGSGNGRIWFEEVQHNMLVSGNVLGNFSFGGFNLSDLIIQDNIFKDIGISPPYGTAKVLNGNIAIRNNTISGMSVKKIGSAIVLIQENFFPSLDEYTDTRLVIEAVNPDQIGKIEVISNENIDSLNADNLSNMIFRSNRNVRQMELYRVSNSVIEKNTFIDNTKDGVTFALELDECSDNTIKDNMMISNVRSRVYDPPHAGIYLQGEPDKRSSRNVISKNIIRNYARGIFLADASDNVIQENLIDNSLIASIHIGNQNPSKPASTSGNKIFNNLLIKSSLSTARNYTIDAPCDTVSCANIWNEGKKAGPNIIGGPFIGGNGWSDAVNKVDSDGDGFLDAPYNLNYENTDQLPLKIPDIILFPGPSNPTDEKIQPQGQPVTVFQAVINNISAASLTAVISSFTFHFYGNGSVSDVLSVTLHKENDIQVGSGSFNGNSITFSGLNETIAPSASVSYTLKYMFKETISPCATYGAAITPANITATMNNIPTEISGKDVTGYIHIPYPPLEIVGESSVTAQRKTLIPGSLIVKIKNTKAEDFPKWQAKFSIADKPLGAGGQKFVNGAQEILVLFNSEGKAQTNLTLGDIIGSYIVDVTPMPVPSSPYNCDGVGPKVSYTAFACGIEVEAELDAFEGEKLGTFISAIKALNKITAQVRLAPWDTRTVQKVQFSISNTISEDTSAPFESDQDMANVSGSKSLIMTAFLSDGSKIEEPCDFHAISIPEWLNVIQKLQTYLNWSFQKEEKRYRLTFTYPGDFIWSKPIPSDIPLIGGEENEAEFELTVNADYYIDQRTGFEGKAAVDTTILGKPFQAEGTVAAQFDSEFRLLPGAAGEFSGSIEFAMPQKTLASKTILVYGVPITLAIDLGGNVNVFVNGAAVFDHQFRIEKASFIPGTTIRLDITASASVAFGVAKIGVTGSPTGTLKIKLSYVTENGVTLDAFGGEISIPITVFGSLFWDAVEGELYSAELGPYSFGDDVERSAVLKRQPRSSGKHLYSSADVAASGSRKIVIWVKDTSGAATEINPEIVCRIDNGAGWQNTVQITQNQLWETDPAAVFLAEGKALAVWTSNKGAKTLTKFNEIAAQQDIAASYYDGTAWQPETRIINDAESDGSARVAFDALSGKAMAVWVHNSNTSENIADRSKWSIYFSVFDPAGQTWTQAAAIPSTDAGDTGADFMPVLASDHQGRFIAVWVKDADGKYFSELDKVSGGTDVSTVNKDCDLYYSVYTSGNWSSPKKITSVNDFFEQMPDVTTTAAGNIAIVWVQKQGDTNNLFSSIYSPAADTWTTPEAIDAAPYLMESPQITVDGSDNAAVVFRKQIGAADFLYRSKKNLKANPPVQWSSPVRLTSDPVTDLWISTAATQTGTILFASAGIGEQAVSAPGMTDNIRMAEWSPTPKAALTKQYSEKLAQPVGTLYAAVEASIGVNVSTGGNFIVKAALVNAKGQKITQTEVRQTLNSGTQTVTLIFSGRRIREAGFNGPYRISEIELIDASLTPIVIDSDSPGFATAAYTPDQFAEPRITVDKQFYQGISDTMAIKIIDETRSGSVTAQVQSSAATAPMNLTLQETASGVFEGTLKFSETAGSADTVKVEEAGVLTLTYQDTIGGIWRETSVWRSIRPKATVLPKAVDFARSSIGMTSFPKSVSVRNDGNANLTVNLQNLSGSQASEFVISGETCSEKLLAPAETCQIPIAFKPISLGAKTANLNFTTNDQTAASVNIPLTGFGVVFGDLNNDHIVSLADAIIALKLGVGASLIEIPSGYDILNGDVNMNGKIGQEEAVYILQRVGM